jgi:hypothetical protein
MKPSERAEKRREGDSVYECSLNLLHPVLVVRAAYVVTDRTAGRLRQAPLLHQTVANVTTFFLGKPSKRYYRS